MAKLADAADLKSAGPKRPVGVRFPLPAPTCEQNASLATLPAVLSESGEDLGDGRGPVVRVQYFRILKLDAHELRLCLRREWEPRAASRDRWVACPSPERNPERGRRNAYT